MTDLPDGFSDDFSKAPDDEIIAYVKLGISPAVPCIGVYGAGEFETVDAYKYGRDDLLCWCPIPTPGDAVLNELAGRGN